MKTSVSGFFHRHPGAIGGLLLLLPMAWIGVVYFGSIMALVLQSFYALDDFTGRVVRVFTLSTYRSLFTASNFDIFVRTIVMASVVTLTAAILAFPLAYFMAMRAGPRTKALLYLAVMLPLWSSYIVRVYAWKTILAKEGVLNWGDRTNRSLRTPECHLKLARDRRTVALVFVYRYVSGVCLYLAPLYGAPDRSRSGAHASVLSGSLG